MHLVPQILDLEESLLLSPASIVGLFLRLQSPPTVPSLRLTCPSKLDKNKSCRLGSR